MAANMFLYWGSGSVPCWRPMIVLEEKGLQGYKNKILTFSKKEHKSEEILKLNPRGQLPTFKDGNTVINESMAICDYLECEYRNQGNKLIPDNRADRAMVLQRKYETLVFVQKAQYDVIRYLLHTKPEDRDQELLKTKKQALVEELNLWEGYLKADGAGSYIAGKSFSMADVIFYPTLAFLARIGTPLDAKYPCLAAYYKLITQRPSVQASWPPHWKGSEGPKVLTDL